MMTIKFNNDYVQEISFKLDKYMNHKVGDEIKIKIDKTNESIDNDIEFVSDALIMAFENRNMDIEEITCLKNSTPEESILLKSRDGQRYGAIRIENITFSIGTYEVPRIVRTGADSDIRLCIIYNNRMATPAQIEGAMSRFYRRIVRFGWCKVGDKTSKNVPSGNAEIRLTCLNINIMRIKPKEKKTK